MNSDKHCSEVPTCNTNLPCSILASPAFLGRDILIRKQGETSSSGGQAGSNVPVRRARSIVLAWREGSDILA